MIIFTIIGMITSIIFLLYLSVLASDYFDKKNKIKNELLDFKNKIEDEDLKKSWFEFLDSEFKSSFWNEKLKW